MFVRLSGLHTVGATRTLPSPLAGVNLAVEMLADKREIIRNEILLLLEALTASNPAIQKIVAFNGAFELLLNIVQVHTCTGQYRRVQ